MPRRPSFTESTSGIISRHDSNSGVPPEASIFSAAFTSAPLSAENIAFGGEHPESSAPTARSDVQSRSRR